MASGSGRTRGTGHWELLHTQSCRRRLKADRWEERTDHLEAGFDIPILRKGLDKGLWRSRIER